MLTVPVSYLFPVMAAFPRIGPEGRGIMTVVYGPTVGPFLHEQSSRTEKGKEKRKRNEATPARATTIRLLAKTIKLPDAVLPTPAAGFYWTWPPLLFSPPGPQPTLPYLFSHPVKRSPSTWRACSALLPSFGRLYPCWSRLWVSGTEATLQHAPTDAASQRQQDTTPLVCPLWSTPAEDAAAVPAARFLAFF